MFLRGWDEGLPLCLFWDDFFFVKFADPVARPAEDLVCCPSASCVLEVFMPAKTRRQDTGKHPVCHKVNFTLSDGSVLEPNAVSLGACQQC